MINRLISKINLNTPSKHYSLASIINVGILMFICSMLILALTTYAKLKTFEKTIESIRHQSLPSIIVASNLYAHMNLLQNQTDRLAMSNSNAMRRIALKGIESQMQYSYERELSAAQHAYHHSQFALFQKKIDKLDGLVVKKLEIKKQLTQKQDQLYELHDVVNLPLDRFQHKTAIRQIQMAFANMLILTGKTLTLDKLHSIQQQRQQLALQLADLNTLIDTQTPDIQRLFKQPYQNLQSIVMSEKNGVLALRIEQLKLRGRIRGLGNLISNLINDYSRLMEFQSYQLNQKVLANVSKNTSLVKQHLKQASLTFTGVFIAYILFAFFIHHFLIKRLKKLNEEVYLRRRNKTQEITISGQDEITQLAKSFLKYAQTIEQQKTTLQSMTQRDQLTGIANRRAFDAYYTQTANLCQRQQQPLAIMLLDVDYFKAFNDNYGHVEGDRCLQQVAALLQNQVPRKSDLVARYGGEEFVILLPNTPEEGVRVVADNILNAFNHRRIPHHFSQIEKHVTISIGIAISHQEGQDLIPPTLNEADQALYQAKGAGRNCWKQYTHKL
ncbi:diguanylate cyclase domain-containing protein [Vibrio zhugei]|uniref:diguanylate cyclase n=1 Tax=Vibrio zhugei TaxID=2479546 RepID=A0ABV7C802_9VIBR|nr:sensor domain-containing diguanylate cyclase [Vibrio zhugei]